jgi:hypothetical protein
MLVVAVVVCLTLPPAVLEVRVVVALAVAMQTALLEQPILAVAVVVVLMLVSLAATAAPVS